MNRPANYKKLLEFDQNVKTVKGQKYGYMTGILYLAPARESGVMNTCPKSTAECRQFCLYNSGMAQVWPLKIKTGRVNKTIFLHENREAFLESLRYDIRTLLNRAKLHKLIPAVRINGTSDLPKIAMQMAREFPEVQFYDYTKIDRPWERTLPNYHITFSFSGNNRDAAMQALAHGINVAVVFDVLPAIKGRRDGDKLPATWNGFEVIDGDESDLRFLDKTGVIVGLRHKGTDAHKAGATGNFIQSAQQNFVPLQAIGKAA